MENPAHIPGPLTSAQLREWQGAEASGILPLNSPVRGFVTGVVVKPTQGKLFGASILNQNVAARFVLMFDAVAVPANGSVPLFPYPVAASSLLGLYFGSVGRAFEQGIVFALSTTSATLTLAGADMWCDAQFV